MTGAARLVLHDLHESAGAGFLERQGFLLPHAYGGPEAVAAEYAAAREAAALVDLSERGLLDASGPQRQSFLQGMLSNEIVDRQPGQGCPAALLTAKGHVQALVRVLVEKDAVRLETPPGQLALVERTLNHHKVAAPVRFTRRPAAVLGVLGPAAGDVLRAAGADLPPLGREEHRRLDLAGQGVLLARAGDLPPEGFVVHVAPEGAAAVWQGLLKAGARPSGRGALDALRVEALRPWYGYDVTEDNLLHETGLLGECHSPTKGCYIGQETVARLEARGGHVNKALRGLRLSAPAAPGALLTAHARPVGHVTTAAVSSRLGPVALGYVHRDHFAPGTTLEVSGAPATVVAAFGAGAQA